MGEVIYGSSHVRSTLGIFKLCEIVTCLLAVILVAVDGWRNDTVDAFYAGTIVGIIISLIVFILSLTEAGHSLNGILKFQFIAHAILMIYLVIVSSIMVSKNYSNTRTAGAIFGLLASFVYLLDAIVSYKAYDVRF